MVLGHIVNEKIRTKDIQILQDVSFETMLLSTKTLDGLKKSGFLKPSPVQLHGIPMGKCGFDLLLEAKSGTGKTAVFTVIALEKIDLSLGLQVVILSPTREIAAQICDVIKQVGSTYTGLCVEAVMGGLPVQDDIEKFSKNNVHIVVGSPGRLKHLIQDQHVDVSSVRLFVLDEADKLTEKGFLTDIKYINTNLPQQKQVIMSSATYPESCKEFLNQFFHGAQHVCPDNNSVLLGVSQKVTYVKYHSNIVKQTKIRFEELLKILSNLPFKQCLIFCNYQARVSELHRMLTKADWPAEMLHGQQDQVSRLGALKTLQEYKCRILISTDLASRGIDASNIDLVINFEPPFEWQTYLHRIGRAGRFGSYGTAVTIANVGDEQKKFTALFKSLNSSVILSEFWDSNIIEGVNNFEIKHKSELNDHTKLNNIDKSIVSNGNKGQIPSNITDHYHLLYTESEPKAEIESFADLLLSYEKYNVAKTSVVSEYACIELPIALDNVLTLENPDPSNQEELVTKKNYSVTRTEKEINYNVKAIDVCSKICSSNHYPRHKKLREQKDLKSVDLEMGTENDKTWKSKIKERGISANETSIEYLATSYKSELGNKSCNGNGNKAEHRIGNNSGRNKHENREEKIPANNFVSVSDPSKYSSSYLKWYKQLKLKTKQIELSLYINELSSIQ